MLLILYGFFFQFFSFFFKASGGIDRKNTPAGSSLCFALVFLFLPSLKPLAESIVKNVPGGDIYGFSFYCFSCFSGVFFQASGEIDREKLTSGNACVPSALG